MTYRNTLNDSVAGTLATKSLRVILYVIWMIADVLFWVSLKRQCKVFEAWFSNWQ